MQKVLVLGGTRFFGKKLVERLLKAGVEVTIATRGQTKDDFGDRVERLTIDRNEKSSMEAAIRNKSWDVVYDNICYSAAGAKDACELFRDRTTHYVFTSTLSVYECGTIAHPEENFDPYTYPIPDEVGEVGYGEGKRLAEAVFFQKASFPVTAVRFPIVLGVDDYTKRLHFHVERIAAGQGIEVPNLQARLSFITSDEAADFLYGVGEKRVQGPINACSDGVVSLQEIVEMIEKELDKKAVIVASTEDDQEGSDPAKSPFGLPGDWGMDTSKAKKYGLTFKPIHEWYPALVHHLALELKEKGA
ncbi:NAD-dependent epimerase/dehydratase family protein [Paenibacillus sp. 1001270B_150601_E10]|uniref:NAD-dependent epimerase/dehydratase family protein n=1 Tax=Paenibacillus sp. 1001270B_150601_E10 TaxID=2787079 RepID=UPI00189D323E|nr:NAD-dependent epimerase/dehydratase family protein [Paenibacillus sp. 1001270B_150601_E10]